MTILEGEFINLRLNVCSNNVWIVFKSFIINLIVKMSNISDNCIILHFSHMLSHNNILITSSSNKNISFISKLFEGYNFITLHTGLKSTNRINFRNKNSCTSSSHSLSASFSDISETCN